MSKIELEKQIQEQKDILQDFECRLHELKGDGQEIKEGQYRKAEEFDLIYRIGTVEETIEIQWLNGDPNEICNKSSIVDDPIQTTSEISEALIAEAKRRGLKMQVGDYLDYMPEIDCLMLRMSNGVGIREIYEDGDWAEIIEPAEEPITINGHEVEFPVGNVSVGCAFISNEWFKETASISEAYDVKLSRKGEDITPQIKQIAKRIEK